MLRLDNVDLYARLRHDTAIDSVTIGADHTPTLDLDASAHKRPLSGPERRSRTECWRPPGTFRISRAGSVGGMGLRDDMRADRAHAIRDRGGWLLYAAEVARRPELVAVVDYRLGRVLRTTWPGKLLATVLHVLARVWSGTDIHPQAQIQGGLLIDHGPGVVVGPGVVMGTMCRLYQGATLGQNHGLEPTLGDYVTVGPGAKVLGGVSIGDRATIGANAVVLIDVPAGRQAVGVPARITNTHGALANVPGDAGSASGRADQAGADQTPPDPNDDKGD